MVELLEMQNLLALCIDEMSGLLEILLRGKSKKG